MSALHRRLPLGDRTTTAVLVAAAVSVAYTLTVLGYSPLPSSGVSVSGTLWHAVAIQSAFALGTVGVPLRVRAGARLRPRVRGARGRGVLDREAGRVDTDLSD